MKEFTAKEARAEAKARNDIARIKKEIYEHIYEAATNGKYCVVYHPEHIELEMPHFVLVMHEFGNKGYKVAWFNKRNELLVIWEDEQPVIDVAPVTHGQWILADDGDGDVCSVCGTDFCNIIYETGNWNYCPNCGAKMKMDVEE